MKKKIPDIQRDKDNLKIIEEKNWEEDRQFYTALSMRLKNFDNIDLFIEMDADMSHNPNELKEIFF